MGNTALRLTRPRRQALDDYGLDAVMEALHVGAGDVVLVRPKTPMDQGAAVGLLTLMEKWMEARGLRDDILVVLAWQGVTIAQLLQEDLRSLATPEVAQAARALEGQLRRFRDAWRGYQAALAAGDTVDDVALRDAIERLATSVDRVFPMDR